MSVLIALAVIAVIIIVLYLVSPFFSPKATKLDGSHVLITGGSSGIGKAVAAEAAKRGAHITLLARNQARLTAAKEYVESLLRNKEVQRVVCISVDLTKDYKSVEKAIKQATEMLGPVTMLVNCAGYAVAQKFEDTEIDDFKKLMDANYIGSVYATRAVIADMKRQNTGRIVFTSSQAGQVGVFGYTAYSASKFALRGFAEALQMEVKPYNIRVTVSFPPDTDTPGYAQENINKPRETMLIAESAGLFQPEYVAKCLIDDAVDGKFLSLIGVDGWMVGNLTAGMCPITTITEALQQILLMGIFRVTGFLYLFSFDRIVRKCKEERGGDCPSNDSS